MTEERVRAVGPAFARYPADFERRLDPRSVEHLRSYGRGLLSDLPRKSVEPIALAAGTSVRPPQEFLGDYAWDRDGVRDQLQRTVAARPSGVRDPLGTVGVVDETSCRKKGTKTPGVQRQYLGRAGGVENGVATVHAGVERGRRKALLGADLFLPGSWASNRDRGRAAGTPDDVGHRPKWQLALDQVRRARGDGAALDRLTFDEGYGDKPGFLAGLEADGVVYVVGEVPRTFATADGPARGLAAPDPRLTGTRWRVSRVPRQTEADGAWEVRAARVRPRRAGAATAGEFRLPAARSRRTDEVKYFASNAGAGAPLAHLVRVAFRRWDVEHALRFAEVEAGLTHYEGRSYVGLTRVLGINFRRTHTGRSSESCPA